MPKGDVSNYFFRGNENLRFEDVSDSWVHQESGFSNGVVSADLDNDGDLDLIFNNLNTNASILENQGNENNSLKINLVGYQGNAFGIGSKVYAYANGKLFYEQLHTTRGFLSSFPHQIHIGLGKEKLDSVIVVWHTDCKEERVYDVKSKSKLVLDHKNATKEIREVVEEKNELFSKMNFDKITHANNESIFQNLIEKN